MSKKSKRNSFSGSIGFVLAAAGSAVGLGNIWRFPYLAAKDGGGLFIVIYIILALTFGFTLLTTEIAIGRKTKMSPLTAYKSLNKRSGFIGIISFIVPMIILPYYCVIGGWVLKYFTGYITGQGAAMAQSTYFTGFITGGTESIIFTLIYLGITAFVIFRGIEKGIESLSRFIMPVLLILVIIIAVFSLTLSYTDADGVTRTGLEGLKILVVPDFGNITVSSFFTTLTDAMGQLFYSLSVAMGIMVTYGSYVKDDVDLGKSVNQIELFDTAVAILAGVMVIPAVYTFIGAEGMSSSGPGLMFQTLPMVFAEMGFIGTIVGILFFALVFFAALTSSISLLEAVVSCFIDKLNMSRKKATGMETGIATVAAIFVCLGYSSLYFDLTLPNGTVGQLLDIFDYVSNSVLMPIVAISTCILVGWVLSPKTIVEEIEKTGIVMSRKRMYSVMVKFIAPALLFILLMTSLGLFI